MSPRELDSVLLPGRAAPAAAHPNTDQSTNASLGWLVTDYGAAPVNDQPTATVPLDAGIDENDIVDEVAADLGWEQPWANWSPIDCTGTPVVEPVRFVDGAVRARTVATLNVDGALRPVLVAVVGAGAVRLATGQLRREDHSLRCEIVVCLLGAGIAPRDLRRLEAGVGELGVRLEAPVTADVAGEFDVLRRRTWDLAKTRMERAEREVLWDDPSVCTVVDGLLERRLVEAASHALPAYGVVKRRLRELLPAPERLYTLRAGQRTPAFVVHTKNAELITWYLRLAEQPLDIPGAGVVRVSTTGEWLATRFPDPAQRMAEISAVCARLRELRCRAASYSRMAVSLEPVVRLEDQLHALLPGIAQQVFRIHRALAR